MHLYLSVKYLQVIAILYGKHAQTQYLWRKIMANLTITLDDQDKKDISQFCEQIGMTVSGLYNVFTKQVLREGRIPFEIALNKPNRKTIKALKEGDKIANGPNAKGYTFDEFVAEMKKW